MKRGLFGIAKNEGMRMLCTCWSPNHVRDCYYLDKGSGGSAQREEVFPLRRPWEIEEPPTNSSSHIFALP